MLGHGPILFYFVDVIIIIVLYVLKSVLLMLLYACTEGKLISIYIYKTFSLCGYMGTEKMSKACANNRCVSIENGMPFPDEKL